MYGTSTVLLCIGTWYRTSTVGHPVIRNPLVTTYIVAPVVAAVMLDMRMQDRQHEVPQSLADISRPS
jgi:hypothetical protein